jgi:hypothetical protein
MAKSNNLTGELEKQEQQINENYGASVKAKLKTCVLLARLISTGTYKTSGAKTEYEYFASNRLSLPKSTASEWKKIGATYGKYENELAENGYTEGMGLKKLLFLETAIKNHNRKSALNNIVVMSYEDFRYWALGEHADKADIKPGEFKNVKKDDKGNVSYNGTIIGRMNIKDEELEFQILRFIQQYKTQKENAK